MSVIENSSAGMRKVSMNTINQSTDRKFKFGVAISYLIQDEDLALKINHLIQDQVKTFIFTERQIELAGRDGEVELIKIFSEQARIDVVLFRKEWGTTPWTRIEKNAIRRRGHGEGYDFTFFIVVDDKDDLPKWLPTTNIWWDLERYELLGAAVAILDKLKDQGGEVKVETASDLTMRLQRDHLVEKQRRAFLNSGKGVQAADELAVELFEMIVEAARESTETGAKSMKTALGQYRDWVRLEYSRYYLLVSWVKPMCKIV